MLHFDPVLQLTSRPTGTVTLSFGTATEAKELPTFNVLYALEPVRLKKQAHSFVRAMWEERSPFMFPRPQNLLFIQ